MYQSRQPDKQFPARKETTTMAKTPAADTETAAAPPKPPKEKLTPEQRREAVQNAREEKIRKAFEGKSFTYEGPISLEKGSEYTDVTGNKGRNGHVIVDDASGEKLVVGPGSLKKAVEVYNAVSGYPPAKPEATAEDGTQTVG